MRKLLSTMVAAALLFSVPLTTNVSAAAAPIQIYIDGVRLPTDQAPVSVGGRTLLPLRAIFEALQADVNWNPSTKVVTATRDNTTIVLKMGSRTASINGVSSTLDVPAQSINSRTMIPVRFVSEAMGEEVDWNAGSKSVFIKTSSGNPSGGVAAVSNVYTRVVGQNGDGRDIEVSFPKVAKESSVDHYRVMIVKADRAKYFNTSSAQAVSSNNYKTVYGIGGEQVVSLSSQSRDTDGDLIRANQAYAAFVLTVGKGSNQVALSSASSNFTLTSTTSVSAATNVKVSDISDYGDGRDMSVSFTKADKDTNISNYRIMVVKTKDANKFDVAAANAVSTQYSTLVNKSGTVITTTLGSSARDTSGELIKNGVSYTAFVLSVNNNSSVYANKLSSGSSSITLNNYISAPVITNVEDVNDYNDARDIQVSFTKSSDESKISYYRVFVVKAKDAGNFNLTDANQVSSGRYYDVGKTGYNIVTTLPSTLRDTQGSSIGNGVDYRVFVMAVPYDKNTYSSMLSSSSQAITLSNNGSIRASNVSASDINDYNDGRDLRVNFNRASDESYISHYRVMVVKATNADKFNVATANNVSSSNYTYVSRTGSNISLTLTAGSRDTDGDYIRNGINYRVFVLSVGSNSYTSTNALSTASNIIQLTNNASISAATNVVASDVSDYNDGRDLRVNFNRAADESNLGHYRVMVVKAANADRFSVGTANNISSSNYTYVSRTGSNISLTLTAGLRDTDGDYIRNDVNYRVFVLSVGTSTNSSANALSAASSIIKLTNNASISAATNVVASDVSDFNDGRDLMVAFNRSDSDSYISQYRIMVVKTADASRFDETKAKAVSSSNYTSVSRTGNNISWTLASNARDVDGQVIRNGISYQVFVLAVGSGSYANSYALSSPSSAISLSSNVAVTGVTNVVANVVNNTDIEVGFTKSSNESNVAEYRIMVVPANRTDAFNLSVANGVSSYTGVTKRGTDIRQIVLGSSRDTDNNVIVKGAKYRVFVLTVADGRTTTTNALSSPSSEFSLVEPAVSAPAVNNVNAIVEADGSSVKVSFDRVANEGDVAYYEVMVVPVNASLTLANANEVGSGNYKVVNTGSNSINFSTSDIDAFGNALQFGRDYKVYVLSVANGRVATINGLSAQSSSFKLVEPVKQLPAADAPKDPVPTEKPSA
ncbi:copper amine oxidase [Paenibacillus selenitireducens]|uniref:Copper amine oxidase n=1 Tax=Paenibacillus selenitireducens TaxID=1324314 RepID=A0A1T2X9H3_9BACL|nr:copper amine oxidase N-terminal domain-containing protein [Paenibacillus selenitireducens]OPA76233.1 copper amine oxidase [Paenibacillus selenitireducens]